MGVIEEINFKIKGQVDAESNKYDVIKAKLFLLCAEYKLDLSEEDDCNF